MGAPPNADALAQMLEDPALQQTMLAALDNPQVIDMMINHNPMLRNIPGAREMLQSPMMRQMLTNPEVMRQAARMTAQQSRGPGFPAPGPATPSAAPNTGEPAGNNAQTGNAAAGGIQGSTPPPGLPPFPFPLFPAGMAIPRQGEGGGNAAPGGQDAAQNPFFALFGPPPGTGATGDGAAPGAPGSQLNPFGNLYGPDNAALRSMLEGITRGFGGNAPNVPAPEDNRPPEVRYEQQLRQLNDMGFYDFDQNVAALRRSGGNIQGAIDHLLNS
jgi:ubiquilin